MAKDSKKEKLNNESKLAPKDKDIHLNVVGVPEKNVNVKKTYPRQNNEDYQLYRISIDTKGKQKERKRRLSSLEPVPKRAKNRHRHSSNDNDVVSSDGSYLETAHPQKPRPHGNKTKVSTPKTKRRGESVDSEICFTIPGEKGKAVRIVGSSTKPHDDNSLDRSSRASSPQRSLGKRTESPRQVGFARLDEVYGTSPEDSSLDSRNSLPYKKTSPQVYKMENGSPVSPFNESKNKSSASGARSSSKSRSPDPNNKTEEQGKPSEHSSRLVKRSKQGEDLQPGTKDEPRRGVQSASLNSPDYLKPSTSKHPDREKSETSLFRQSGHSRNFPGNNSTYDTSSAAPTSTSYYSSINEPTSGKSSESKGKYPFYPYDKQKRSKSPSKQDQRSEKEEVQGYPKLESIPEVRSTEHYPLPDSSSSLEHNVQRKEPLVLTEPITKSNEAKKNTSPVPLSPEINSVPTTPASSKPLKKQNDPVSKNEHQTLKNLFKHKKPEVSTEVSPQKLGELTSQSPSKVQTNDNSKQTLMTSSNTQRGSPILFGVKPLPKLSQLQRLPKKTSQTTPPTSPKMPTKSGSPVMSYNVQNTSPLFETPSTNKRELQNKPSGLAPAVRSRNSAVPQESSLNKLRTVENQREPTFKKDQVTAINKAPIVMKRPETVDKQVNTETPLKPRDRIMLEINEELSKKSSPLNQKPLQGSVNRTVSKDEKDSKRTKSKLSTFVSSIPKPLFGRNKSLEKKSTDRSVVPDKNKPEPEQNPIVTKGKDDVRKPVEESAIVKKAHEPIVEAYPEWVDFPAQQQAENRMDDIQPQTFKDGPISGKGVPKKYSKEFTPYEIDDSSSVEIANRSYGEHPLARGTSTAPTVSEQVHGPVAAGEEEGSSNYLGNRDEVVKVDEPQSSKPEDKNHLHDSHSNASFYEDLEHTKDPGYDNYGKSRPIFESPNVVAYPGQLNEQTPFGYESQFPAGSKDDTKALISLEEGFDAYKRQTKSKEDSTPRLVDRNPSLVSRASRNQKDESKQKLIGYPVQVLNDSISFHPSSESRTPKELNYNINKNGQAKNMAFNHGNKADDKPSELKGDSNRSRHTPSSLSNEKTKTKPFSENIFGKTPVEQVYAGHVPDTTQSVFNPEDPNEEPSPYKGKSKAPTTKQQGPKGILIFVNKKNVTGSPFDSGPTNWGEGSSRKAKNRSGPQKKKKKRGASSSGDTSASTILGSSSYASGDPNVAVEKSPSGRKTTLKYPCGCIQIITTDPMNKSKREELITAFCKEGSKCEVSRRQKSQLRRSIDSSSVSSDRSSTDRPDRSRMFPDIEVIADGIVSRNPIQPRKPAPTMNGAKLTGSFKINSNKVNGVCNFYLDKKLKKYLRNNMDKIKQILED